MDNLIGLLSKANRHMTEYIQEELKKKGYNLHPSHGNIMINFVHTDSMNYRELSKKTNKSPQTMTTLIRKLVDEGLVVINVDIEDKRNKLVSLTEEGKRFIDVMLDISNHLFIRQYQGITNEEQDILKGLLEKVIGNFDE